MIVYVVMIKDRHFDPEAHIFSTKDKALGYAKSYIKEQSRDEKDIEYMNEDGLNETGWLFYAEYSCEGDAIWILPSTIDED